ncbi:MAG: WYL domain-containing protein, partial [Muribaculaceae bacterium]|nr:WYL domain-containing protein [Muribaculaceae bacterium]
MATSVRLIRRYAWLIDTIRQAKCITLEEINRKWMEEKSLRLEDEGEIPERTFHRHRQAIADIFGIDIL